MKFLIALLIALLLPLQLSWGVAARYCEHETGLQAGRHFGHHSHVHANAEPHEKAAADSAQDPGAKPGGAKLLIDLDCSFCHAPSATALLQLDLLPPLQRNAAAPAVLGNAKPASVPQRTPDRPQWPRLA
ncbi:cobalt-zinc-cadmium resistance protein [Paucibacter sp. APW11]|uniref:Cobalt-zinc-cadmium resistance protein n=1 Tax=Roseateles aquae TaxID=3077235 RepID=A0ABU3PAY9_9BURK|nr:cation efflux protein, CzcI family [Paucibacter sp. APW11]MDT8999704.1 cobalt-zinc-cadmium resistance protein [Paucibacter sp. APW11]